MLPQTILQLKQHYRARELSPEEVTKACLDRIDSEDLDIRAFLTVSRRVALGAARSAELLWKRDKEHPALLGVPIAVKDNIDTRGIRTTIGSRIFQSRVPVHDATVVRRLRAAGAIIIGKTNLDEFGVGAYTRNPHYGATFNPRDSTCSPGGSSGGSAAAVAAGFAYGALATSTGGSIGLPAAWCGVSGLKPTFGVVPRTGVFVGSPTLDHVGVVARTVKDLSLLLSAIAGYDEEDPASLRITTSAGTRRTTDLKPLRAGFCSDVGRHDQPEVVENLKVSCQVLRDLGLSVVPVTIPIPDRDLILTIAKSEIAHRHRDLVKRHRRRYSTDLLTFVDDGVGITQEEILAAYDERSAKTLAYRRIFASVDVIVRPAASWTAIVSHAGSSRRRDVLTQHWWDANVLGLPALTMPNGLDAAGLPTAFQIVGPPGSDAPLLRIGIDYERAAGKVVARQIRARKWINRGNEAQAAA